MCTSVDARARVGELPCESDFLCPVGTCDDDAAGYHQSLWVLLHSEVQLKAVLLKEHDLDHGTFNLPFSRVFAALGRFLHCWRAELPEHMFLDADQIAVRDVIIQCPMLDRAEGAFTDLRFLIFRYRS
jgi:hypothetical protein